MVYGGNYIWPLLRTMGAIPSVSTRSTVSIENSQADTGRDGQTCLAKRHVQARTGTRLFFPAQLTMNRIGNLPVDLYSAICDDNTRIHIYCCSVYAQLPPVIGAPWGYCGHASGIFFPVRYGSVGVQLTRLRRLNQGTLTSECVRKI